MGCANPGPPLIFVEEFNTLSQEGFRDLGAVRVRSCPEGHVASGRDQGLRLKPGPASFETPLKATFSQSSLGVDGNDPLVEAVQVKSLRHQKAQADGQGEGRCCLGSGQILPGRPGPWLRRVLRGPRGH